MPHLASSLQLVTARWSRSGVDQGTTRFVHTDVAATHASDGADDNSLHYNDLAVLCLRSRLHKLQGYLLPGHAHARSFERQELACHDIHLD